MESLYDADIKIMYGNITNRMKELGIPIDTKSLIEFLATERLYIDTEKEIIDYHNKEVKRSTRRAIMVITISILFIVGMCLIVYFGQKH